MKSIKKILLVTPGFPDGEGDTSCIPALQVFIKNLAKREDVELTILSIHYPFTAGWQLWFGIRVYSFAWGNCAIWKKPLLWKKMLKKTLQLVGNDFDLVHSFWLGEASMLAAFIARMRSCPHVLTYMGQDVLASNRYRHFAGQFVFDREILLSERHSLKYQAIINDKINRIIPWGIDPNDFYDLDSQVVPYDVLGLGSLIGLKKYDDFLQVISSVKKGMPNVRAALAGDGELRDDLKALCEKLGLSENVTFLGSLKREMALAYLAKAKVLLHPSEYESYGYVFQEAIYCEVPIVSRPVGSAVQSQHWRIESHCEGMAESVVSFLKEKPEDFQSQVTLVEDTCSQYLAVYESLLNGLL